MIDKVTFGRYIFGPITHITLITQLIKFLDNLITILRIDIINGIPYIFFFFDLLMVLITRELINPFTDIPREYFGFEDVIFIFSIP